MTKSIRHHGERREVSALERAAIAHYREDVGTTSALHVTGALVSVRTSMIELGGDNGTIARYRFAQTGRGEFRFKVAPPLCRPEEAFR